MSRVQRLGLYASAPHDCHYLPGREALVLFADPDFPLDARIHAALSGHGFRRSGENLYRPHCQRCSACTPVRIPVAEFSPSRNQRRTWRRNQDLSVRAMPAAYHSEHFQLYRRYLKSRHPGGGMDAPTLESYMGFLTASWAETLFYEMRSPDDELLALAVVDRMQDALSAVYTCYSPEETRRSLGRYAILYAIEQAKSMGLKWLYLGYWINECTKMAYKNEYQPLEYRRDEKWRPQP